MSHMLEGNGKRAAYATPAWHRLGIIASEAEQGNTAAFLATAKMDYAVAKEPAAIVNPDGSTRVIANQFHLVRSDDRKVVSPHTVTAQYQEVCPSEIAAVMDYWVSEGFAKWDSGFTLYGGSSEVLSARVEIPDLSGPDGPEGMVWYLVGQNSHARCSARFICTGTRTVCHNTVTAAFGSGSDLSYVHRVSITDRLADAKRVWAAAQSRIRKFVENAQILADKEYPTELAVDAILGIEKGKKVTTNKENLKLDLLSRANDATSGTYGRSLYDVFNAVTNHNTHSDRGIGKARDESDRIASMFDGQRARFELNAFDTLLALASN